MKSIANLVILSLLILGSCTSGDQTIEEIVEPESAVNTDNIMFTKISKQHITDIIECTGRIDVPPNQRSAIYAPIGAVVNGITILPGDAVKKGQVLFTMVHQDLVIIQQEYLQAKADFELLKVNLDRKQKLYEAESTSEKDLRTAEHGFNIGKANFESLKSQLTIIGVSYKNLESKGISTSVQYRAPITGYISEIFVVSGSFVNVNSPILTIVNTDHKHVELEIYADKISSVKVGQEVGFHTAGSSIEHRAEIHLIGKDVHADTRTVSVHAHLEDESIKDLTIGSYLYAGIMISSDQVYSLPLTAIIKFEGKNYILVKDNSQLNSVEVTLGKSFKEYVEIKDFEKLLEQEIVADDAYYLFKGI